MSIDAQSIDDDSASYSDLPRTSITGQEQFGGRRSKNSAGAGRGSGRYKERARGALEGRSKLDRDVPRGSALAADPRGKAGLLRAEDDPAGCLVARIPPDGIIA